MEKSAVIGSWFEDLVGMFKPGDSIEVTGTPEEMTCKASKMAFVVSTTAGIPPGPLGMTTILPELLAITKLQIDLVYRIAKFHKKERQVTNPIVLHILATSLGIVLGRNILRKMGVRFIVKALSIQAVRDLAQKLGIRITQKLLAKMGGRWIPFITAPIFGTFSKMQTTRVGKTANEIFSSDIEFEKFKYCSKGHEAPSEAKFCYECGEKLEPSV